MDNGKYSCPMNNLTRIHIDKNPPRRHYIVEWAEHRNMKQVDISRELGANKGTVSKWFGGAVPRDDWLQPLAELLNTTTDGLFRHPDDDWITRFFHDRSAEEKRRAMQILEAAFPPPERKAG